MKQACTGLTRRSLGGCLSLPFAPCDVIHDKQAPTYFQTISPNWGPGRHEENYPYIIVGNFLASQALTLSDPVPCQSPGGDCKSLVYFPVHNQLPLHSQGHLQ